MVGTEEEGARVPSPRPGGDTEGRGASAGHTSLGPRPPSSAGAPGRGPTRALALGPSWRDTSVRMWGFPEKPFAFPGVRPVPVPPMPTPGAQSRSHEARPGQGQGAWRATSFPAVTPGGPSSPLTPTLGFWGEQAHGLDPQGLRERACSAGGGLKRTVTVSGRDGQGRPRWF